MLRGEGGGSRQRAHSHVVTISDNWLGSRARARAPRATFSSVFHELANFFGDSIDATIMDTCRLYVSPPPADGRRIPIMSLLFVFFFFFSTRNVSRDTQRQSWTIIDNRGTSMRFLPISSKCRSRRS